jgi:hypothetical protein
MVCGSAVANAQLIIGGSLKNGDLDATIASEINPPAPGFFLPKPTVWQNTGSRTLTGPYEDEMSSEPWAGPAPTPVTANGNGLPGPDGCSGLDCAVFFKAFSGNTANGPATGTLFQDNPASPGLQYAFAGWAGAEANFLAASANFGIDFLNAGNAVIGGASLNLLTNGLLTPNGQSFNYKKYTVKATAPAGTATIRVSAGFVDGIPNPLGGGQAFVVDDFTLAVVPEPTSLMLGLIAVFGAVGFARRR